MRAYRAVCVVCLWCVRARGAGCVTGQPRVHKGQDDAV